MANQSVPMNQNFSYEAVLTRWKQTFLTSLLQFSLDLWNERNKTIHGSNPAETRHIARTKVIEKAKQLFLQGPESVPLAQRKLYQHFENRLQHRTQAIEHWIQLIQIAQKKRQEELEQLANQKKLQDFSFTKKMMRTQNQTLLERREPTNLEANNNKQANWAQQDLRQLFLLPKPNVRYK